MSVTVDEDVDLDLTTDEGDKNCNICEERQAVVHPILEPLQDPCCDTWLTQWWCLPCKDEMMKTVFAYRQTARCAYHPYHHYRLIRFDPA